METMSVIIPAYNEELNIEKTADVIGDIMDKSGINAEIIFVDDGSADSSWEIISRLADEKKNIRGLKFSRNFGKEGAIFAGLEACKGDCAVVIDCDLQHPPELMTEMYNLWKQGYQVVEAVKASRGKEGLFYKVAAKCFYNMMKSSSNVDLNRASDYKLMDRAVIDELNKLPERQTFFRALSSWVGFKTTKLEFHVAPRNAGKTKWNYKKLIKFALSNLTGFTSAPLQIVTVTGILFLLGTLAELIVMLVRLCCGNPQTELSVLVLLITLSGGISMLALGVIGYYIAKIYEEIKNRPRYIVSVDTDKMKRSNDNK